MVIKLKKYLIFLTIFFDIFYLMDNIKGKKGKLFFINIFIIKYHNKILLFNIIIMNVLVMDNKKVNIFNKNIFLIKYD